MSYLGNSPGVASQRTTTTITAASGQTVFITTGGYQLGYLDVYLNGSLLVSGDDYTATNGTSITLTQAAAVDDIVHLVSYIPRGLSDGYLKAEADAKFLIDNVSTINNLLDVDTATTVPTNGQTLIWNNTTSRWLPGTIAGGVTSITGTANQITASSSTGAITLSLPQSINTTSSPSFATVTLTGELRGPSTLIIDPAVVGDDTGTVRIRGNLQVDGTTTTVNSTTLEVADLNITLAKNAANAAAATGAGITVAGAAATLLYTSSTDSWSFNKSLNITNNLDVDGDINIDGGDLTASGSSFNLINTNITTANLFGVATSVNIAANAATASNLVFGPFLSGNALTINAPANGLASILSGVSSGTVNLFTNVDTGTINLANMMMSGGTINIGSLNASILIGSRMLINGSAILPVVDNATDLGSFTARWRNIYTADMHFSNQGSQNSVDGTWGNWTLQEGEENIYMLNNRTGRRYKIALEEV